MAIIYRTSGPWGPGKGINLLAGEVDGNFYTVDTRIGAIEGTIPTLTSIVGFTVSGNSFYVHLSNGTAQGPFVLPQTTWNFVGPWQANTHYTVNDVLNASDGGVYMVLASHNSAASFNPGANDAAGTAYYGLMLMQPNVLPPGGDANVVLSKLTGLDYDVTWRAIGELPAGGVTDQVPRKASSADYDIVWSNNSLRNLSDAQIDTTPVDADYLRYDLATDTWKNQSSAMFRVTHASSSYTPSLADVGGFVIINNATAPVTVTLPTDATELFRDGAEINIHQGGTGPITIVGDTGVSLLYSPLFTNKLVGQYATATVKKTAVNEWRLFGLLEQPQSGLPGATFATGLMTDTDTFPAPTVS